MSVTDYRANSRRGRDPRRLRRITWACWCAVLAMLLAVVAWGSFGARAGSGWWIHTAVPLFLLGRVSYRLFRTRESAGAKG